jgi:hypothetical protein
MRSEINCSSLYCSSQRKLLRLLLPIFYFSAGMLLLVFYPDHLYLLLLFFPILLVVGAKISQCPNCGTTSRYYIWENSKDTFFYLSGFSDQDGTCWNCGAILNEKKWQRHNQNKEIKP